MGRYWVGADPGGRRNFGLAFLDVDAVLRCATVSSVEEAVECIFDNGEPLGLGIDAPLWWSSDEAGNRMADEKVRNAVRGKCKSPSGTVQSLNSLRGAALIGGALLAFRVRQEFPCVQITESHPKALLYALQIGDAGFAERFRIPPTWDKENDHERDAAIAAVCAREGFEKRWKTDLARQRHRFEMDPQDCWLQRVHYFWPEYL